MPDTLRPGRFLYILAVNVAVGICAFLALDFALSFTPVALPPTPFCRDNITWIRHCPGTTDVAHMHPEDGGGVVTSHWNLDGIRVSDHSLKTSRTDSRSFDVILIGDSFVEQRQVAYRDMVASRLEDLTGLSVSQVGNGGWSVLNYRNWVESRSFSSGSIVAVFVMANDLFGDTSPHSNVAQHRRLVRTEPTMEFGLGRLPPRVRSWLRQNSASYRALPNLRSILDRSNRRLDSVYVRIDSLALDCPKRPLLEGGWEPWVIEQAYNRPCWGHEMESNFQTVLSDLRAIDKHLSVQGASMMVVIVPGGWSVPGQMPKHGHRFTSQSRVTMAGAASALKSQVSAPVWELEGVLSAAASTGDRLYYRYDGHWTAHGSAVVADYLSTKLALSGR